MGNAAMMEIVDKLLNQHNIKIKKWSKSSCGIAYHDQEIKIPIPEDYETLGICFHEIGHIVLGHWNDKIKKTRYVEEYEAEQYAIQKLKEFGYYNKSYEFQAISYVLSKLAQAKNRGHNMRMVPKEIVKWTGLKVNRWNKAKKVFVPIWSYNKRKDIKVYFK